MHRFSIEVEKRETMGKNKAKSSRKNDLIPGVVYGHKEKNRHFLVKRDDMVPLLRKLKGEPAIIELSFKDESGDNMMTIIKEYQKDPMTDRLIHLDLQLIHAKEALKVTVPVVTKGTPEGVKTGGILEISLRELHIEALPDNLPDNIELDVSSLKMGDKIHVKDIEFKNARCLNESYQLIAAVIAPKAAKAAEEKTEAETAVSAEGAESAEAKEE
ncbi:50S ribosomal protein L25 [candidate division WOR-3 bacterium]|nr:50S ribosomal protein L25 [candidate division WOR-3 bacterium]